MPIRLSEPSGMGRAMRAALGLVLVAGTAGCLDGGGGGNGGGFLAGLGAPRQAVPERLLSATLAGGAIVVDAPGGFCIDRGATESAQTGTFAMLVSCASLGAGNGAAPAIMTVTVSDQLHDGPAPSAEDLAVMTREHGVAAQRMRDGVAIVQLGTGGDRAISAADPRHWRGALVVNRRLVGLAAYGPPDSAFARSTGGRALARLGRQIRNASPRAAASDQTAPIPTPAPTRAKAGLGQMLRRLFQ